MANKSHKITLLLEVLSKHPEGVSLKYLSQSLGVHIRTIKRYLLEARREGFLLNDLREGANQESIYVLEDSFGVPKHFVPTLKKIGREFKSWGNPKFSKSLAQVTVFLKELEENRFSGELFSSHKFEIEKEKERELYHVDHGPFSQEKVSDSILKIVENGIIQKSKIRMVYSSYKNERRELELFPYALSLRVGVLYVIGREGVNKGVFKSFLIQRIKRCTSLSESFTPSPFNIKEYYKYCFGKFPRQINERPSKVVLEVREAWLKKYLLESHFNPTGTFISRNQFAIDIVIKPDFVNWVLSFMPALLPIAPKSLVAEVKKRVALSSEILS